MANLFDDIPEGTDPIEVRKKINGMFAEARSKAKPEKCILCENTQTSFCNSHSVPQMCLKAIADKGKLLLASAAIGINCEIVDIENGVNNSGTFHFICRDCDNKYFQDYENPNNLQGVPTDKMLGEIAVKNTLLQLSKRYQEKELINIQQREFHAFDNPENYSAIKDLDIKEYLDELQIHRDIVENNKTGAYQILFYKILPYKVPLAMQSSIAMTKDMTGNPINDVYDMNPSVRMQYMHLCVFPMDNCSTVVAFYHKKDKKYRNLRHQFNATSEQNVLAFLNYVIFAFTENYYLSKSVQEEVATNDRLQKLAQENNGLPQLGLLGPDNMLGINYKSVTKEEIPNFLDSKWAVI